MVTKGDISSDAKRQDSRRPSDVDDYEVAVILAQTSAMVDGKFKSSDTSSVAGSETEYSGAESAISSPTPSDSGSDLSTSDSCYSACSSRRKRARTAFSNEQVYKLEKKFRDQKYLSPTEREEFADKIGLSETQIKTWFQNRRMKWKRQRKDYSDDAAPLDPHPYSAVVNPSYPSPLIPSPPAVYRTPVMSSPLQPMTTVHLHPPTQPMVPMPYHQAAVPTLSYQTMPPMRAAFAPAMHLHPAANYNIGPIVSSPYRSFHGQYSLPYFG